MDIKRVSVKREAPAKMYLRNSGLNKVNQSPFCRHFIFLNQDGNLGHFLLWSPSPEDQLTALQRQDSTGKIPEPGGEAQKPRRISQEGEEACLHLERMEPSPRPAQSPTERAPMGLVLPAEKESPRWTPSTLTLQDASQKAHSGLTSQGSLGKCAVWPHMEKGAGLTATSVQMVVD